MGQTGYAILPWISSKPGTQILTHTHTHLVKKVSVLRSREAEPAAQARLGGYAEMKQALFLSLPGVFLIL